MKDNELVYALYVQANPVPDPDLLSLTRAEAQLLTIERSPDMDTQQRIEVRPTQPARRRRAFALVFGASLVAIGAAVAIVLLVTGGGDEPVAAADASPRITFDGTTCRYDGPTLIEEGTVAFTVVNTSTPTIQFVGWNMPPSGLDAELERTPLGTDMALTPTSPTPDGTMSFLIGGPPGEEGTGTSFLLPGSHVVDCVTDTMDHVWRAGTLLEVVAR